MNSAGLTILYNSGQIRESLRRLFESPSSNSRRVAIVAYIGDDWSAFLPNAKGMLIVCSPTPGATSAEALAELQSIGAEVMLSDQLHMKVYWSQGRGCVLTSANLSMNAFGIDGLKEAGVVVDATSVDIDQLLREADAYPAEAKHLKQLRIEGDRYNRKIQQLGIGSKSERSYLEWAEQDSAVRTPWKLGWWNNEGEVARSAKALVREQYGKSGVANLINCAKGQYKSEDWLLQFELDGAKYATWMFVHHVVEVSKSDRVAYEKDYPFQAIQVHPNRACGRAPFKIDRAFRSAFKKAVQEFGIEKIETRQRLNVPKKIEDLIAKYIRQADEDL